MDRPQAMSHHRPWLELAKRADCQITLLPPPSAVAGQRIFAFLSSWFFFFEQKWKSQVMSKTLCCSNEENLWWRESKLGRLGLTNEPPWPRIKPLKVNRNLLCSCAHPYHGTQYISKYLLTHFKLECPCVLLSWNDSWIRLYNNHSEGIPVSMNFFL